MIKELAIEQIEEARRYTEGLVEAIPESDWYRIPGGGVTNVAWQVAHIAMAEYRLGLNLVRGEKSGDESLMPPRFLDYYGRGSTPTEEPTKNFSATDIRTVLTRVHEQFLRESADWTDGELSEKATRTHRLFTNKIDALWWCARHEMLHAGQIGLVRRMLGASPIW